MSGFCISSDSELHTVEFRASLLGTDECVRPYVDCAIRAAG